MTSPPQPRTVSPKPIRPRLHEEARWREAGLAGLGYLALTLLLGRDVLARLSDVIVGGGTGDNLWYVWSLWIFGQNVAAGHDPGHTNAIFALLPSVQIFTDGFFNQALAWPLQAFLSPLAAYNVVVLLQFLVLSGLTTYLLARVWVRSPLACFAAGCFYDFSTYHFARADGHLGLLTLQWLPFCAWRAVVFFRRPTPGNAVLAGLGLALVPLSEIYYLPYFLLPFGALFLLGKVLTPEGRAWLASPRRLALAGLAALTAAIIAGPALIGYLRVDSDVREVAAAAAQQITLQADLLAFVLPTPTNPLFGASTGPIYDRMQITYPVEQSSFLGYPALLLGLGALLFRRNRSRAAWFWLALGLVGLVLALGNALHVGGRTILDLPTYRLVYAWPGLSTFRAPNRLAILPLLSLSILSAFTIEAVLGYVRRDRTAAIAFHFLLVVLLCSSFAMHAVHSLTLAVTPVPVPDLYRQIAADPGDALLLDLPLSPYVLNPVFQYYQTIHHKPLVDGNAPRVSARMRGSVESVPFMTAFTQNAQPAALGADIFPHVAGLMEGLQDSRIGYVVLHDATFPDTAARSYRFLEDELGTPFYDSRAEGLAAWRVPPAAPQPNDDAQIRWRSGDGWLGAPALDDGEPQRATGGKAQLQLTAPRAEEQRLSFEAAPYFASRTLRVRLNDTVLTTVRLEPGRMTPVDLGVVKLQKGENLLELEAVEGCDLPRVFDPTSPDPRCFGFAIRRFRLSPP